MGVGLDKPFPDRPMSIVNQNNCDDMWIRLDTTPAWTDGQK